MSRGNYDDSAAGMVARMDAVIQKNGASVSAGMSAMDGGHSYIPLNQLVDADEETDQELAQFEEQVRLETLRRLLMYLCQDGLQPLAVLKCFYAVLKAVRPDLLGGMSLEDIAVLSGDSGRATPMERIKRIYEKPLKAAGMKGTKAPHQKNASTAEKCSAAQKGNRNRRNGARKKARRRDG